MTTRRGIIALSTRKDSTTVRRHRSQSLFHFFMLVSIAGLTRCGTKQPESKDSVSADTLAITQSDEILTDRIPVSLVIQGKDIWVRDSPRTGSVVMKLNTGDTCKVLERGPFQIIRKNPHHWYRIEFKGQQGWVFGAQSNLPPSRYAKEMLAFWKDYHERVCQTCPNNPSDESFTLKDKTTGEDPSDYHETILTWSLQELGENFLVISKSKEMLSSAGKTIKDSFEIAYYPGVQWFLTSKLGEGVVSNVFPAKNDVIFISHRTELHPSGAAGERHSWYAYRLDLTHPDHLDSIQKLAVSYSGVFLNEVSPGQFTSTAMIEPTAGRTILLSEWLSEFEGRIDEARVISDKPRETRLIWDVTKKRFIVTE